MNPLFSIIIPSYNQGQFIAQTINSILEQPYKNVEIIVIDGASTDHTIDILKSYGDKIFWISEKDNGQTHAINKGIRFAKGDIITYLNSDDFYLDHTLDLVSKNFDFNNSFWWLTGDYMIVNEDGQEMQSMIRRYKTFFRNRLSFNVLSVINPIVQPSTFLSKSMIEKVGLFNEELHYTMDYEYWIRAIKIQKPIVLKDRLSAFRIHSKSKGGSQYKNQFDEELMVARKYQKNPVLILWHVIHNYLILIVYKFIK